MVFLFVLCCPLLYIPSICNSAWQVVDIQFELVYCYMINRNILYVIIALHFGDISNIFFWGAFQNFLYINNTFFPKPDLCSVVSNSWRPPWTVVPQDSSVLGSFQARILEWVAISFSKTWSICVCNFLLWILLMDTTQFSMASKEQDCSVHLISLCLLNK